MSKESPSSKRLRSLREIECTVTCATLAMSGTGALVAGLVLALFAWMSVLHTRLFWIGLLMMIFGTALLWAWKRFFWDPFLHQLEDLS